MAKTFIMSNTATMHLFDGITDPNLKAMKRNLIIKKFSDGEISVEPECSVRGSYVYLFAETSHNLTELLLTLDSLKRSNVFKVILILPYYGYCRQDKRKNTRGSLGAAMVAQLVQSYDLVNTVVVFDVHAEQIKGFWQIPVENIGGHHIFKDIVENMIEGNDNIKLCAPDMGARDRVRVYSKMFNIDMVVIDKHREVANEIESMMLIGDVKGKDIIVFDDITDTCGTLVKGVDLLKEKGAKTIKFVGTHAVLSGAAFYNLSKSKISELITSDTLNPRKINESLYCDFITVVSCLPVLERVIKAIINDESVKDINT